MASEKDGCRACSMQNKVMNAAKLGRETPITCNRRLFGCRPQGEPFLCLSDLSYLPSPLRTIHTWRIQSTEDIPTLKTGQCPAVPPRSARHNISSSNRWCSTWVEQISIVNQFVASSLMAILIPYRWNTHSAHMPHIDQTRLFAQPVCPNGPSKSGPGCCAAPRPGSQSATRRAKAEKALRRVVPEG